MRRPNKALRAEDALGLWDAAGPPAAAAALTVKCKLMTPMYGGGVTPGEVDRGVPIRPGAVRGNLRYWWRLLSGAGREPRDLFAAESALWGGISSTGPRASRVALHVRGESIRPTSMVKAKDRDSRFPTYAFILERYDDPDLLRDGYEFTLTLRVAPGVASSQREQVVESLRWWTSFGGVGARTRRGLGAVAVTESDVELKPVTREEVETRGGRMVLGRARKTALDAWQDAVEALQNFRQGEDLGRNRGSGKRPGRSRWPEPDAIRRRTQRHAPRHEPTHSLDRRYPRTAFGLPIVFQFKDQGDPKGSKGKGLTLGPADGTGDRMASPLILRPYFDGTGYRPLALLLPDWEKRVSVPVDLDSERVGPAWPEDADERKACAALVAPMAGRGADDVLTAFLHYFEHHGRGAHFGRGGRRRGGR